MRKVSKLMTVALAAVLTVGAANNAAISSPANFKYAVVDVQKVVESSKQVQALRTEQNTKMRELSEFVQKANKQLQAETDATKKKALETKLNKELNTKKANNDKAYAEKLKKIDADINAVIAQKAKLGGYDLVVAKGVVLYSTGTDITAEVVSAVK